MYPPLLSMKILDRNEHANILIVKLGRWKIHIMKNENETQPCDNQI